MCVMGIMVVGYLFEGECLFDGMMIDWCIYVLFY